MLLYDYLQDITSISWLPLTLKWACCRDLPYHSLYTPPELGILVLAIMIRFILGASRVRRHLAAPTIRLPNGRLDN